MEPSLKKSFLKNLIAVRFRVKNRLFWQNHDYFDDFAATWTVEHIKRQIGLARIDLLKENFIFILVNIFNSVFKNDYEKWSDISGLFPGISTLVTLAISCGLVYAA